MGLPTKSEGTYAEAEGEPSPFCPAPKEGHVGKVEGEGAEGTAVTSQHLSASRQARTLGNLPASTKVGASALPVCAVH